MIERLWLYEICGGQICGFGTLEGVGDTDLANELSRDKRHTHTQCVLISISTTLTGQVKCDLQSQTMIAKQNHHCFCTVLNSDRSKDMSYRTPSSTA